MCIKAKRKKTEKKIIFMKLKGTSTNNLIKSGRVLSSISVLGQNRGIAIYHKKPSVCGLDQLLQLGPIW